MQIKVRLPSGEVNIPVEPNSTPGHLKENLKYSLRVPPKLIRLTCEGRELDDIKPLTAEPNCVADGAILLAEAKEGVPEEEAPKEQVRPPQQTIIKKEEPPKPKKPKKDEIRPTVGDKDVVKKKVIEPGYKPWAPEQEWLTGKSSKRHMAFVKLEAVEDKKTYPEQEDTTLALALGDPHTSPAWAAALVVLVFAEPRVAHIWNWTCRDTLTTKPRLKKMPSKKLASRHGTRTTARQRIRGATWTSNDEVTLLAIF